MVERVWCPQCKKWVPLKEMNYDFDEDGTLLRMCNFCMDGTENTCIEEPHHEETQCIYCDSYNTKELAPNWNRFECLDCGATFRRYV